MTDLERAILHINTRADAWAVKEIEKALSQEPCDDAISRAKVLEMITDFATLELYIDKHNHVTFEPLEKLIKSLPSVTPTCEEREKGECPYYAG